MRTLIILGGALLSLFGGGAQAAADPADVASIDAIIRAYYEVVSGPAGERADAARDASLHHPDAFIAIAGTDANDLAEVRTMTVADYHGDNAPRASAFYERELDREVRRSGNMAHVWSRYGISDTPTGAPRQRGVNSINLYHDGSRWWIMSWMYDASVH